MFTQLEEIGNRPEPFEFYTAADLWTDDHTSGQMLAYHLDSEVDLSSRRGEFIERSVKWITSHFGVGHGTRIVDFGCGPGLYTNRLARYGAHVTGIDFSKRSLSYARGVAAKAGLNVDYVNRNYLDFESREWFDLIAMIMCDFCALSPVQRGIMLEKFHTLLVPGGALLLDVYSVNAFDGREEATSYGVNTLDGFWSPERYHCFLNTFKYGEAMVTLDKYTIVEKDRIRKVYNWLQYFTPRSLRSELEGAGFVLQSTFANVAGDPFDESGSEFAVVGRREA